MKKMTKSIKTDEETWKGLKMYCVENGKDISEVVNDLIRKLLQKK